MCRSSLDRFAVNVDAALKTKIQTAYPKEYAQREIDFQNYLARIVKKKILYGNSHKLEEQSQYKDSQAHKWTAFVRMEGGELASKFIEKVTFDLHPTFKKNHYEFTREPFELSTVGWGTFEVPIKIYWKDWLKLPPAYLDYHLSFDGEGVTKTYTLEYEKLTDK